MLELGCNGDLAEKPVGTQRPGELRMKSLQRHQPVVGQVTRQVDRRHSAAAQLALDAIPAGHRDAHAQPLVAVTAGPSHTRSASRKAAAEGHRSAGSLARARTSVCSTAAVTSGQTVRTGGTGSAAWRARMTWGERPANGGT